MGVHLPKYKYSYFSVPKCACTSLKHFFFEIENGRPFQRFSVNGRQVGIHVAAYKSPRFDREMIYPIEGNYKTAVLRHPVARIISCYTNRIVFHEALKNVKFTPAEQKAGAIHNPDISNFIALIDLYRGVSRQVDRHCRPFTHFLGTDAGYYDRLFSMDELPEFVADVKERVGEVPELRHLQSEGPKMDRSDLSANEIAKIEQMYEVDFRLFGRKF